MEAARPKSQPIRPPAPDQSMSLKQLKRLHDEAYASIEKGLSADELGSKEESITLYNKGISLLERGLAISCEHEDANKLQTKMRKTKLQIEMRLRDMISTPPSYEETLASDLSMSDSVMTDSSSSESLLEGQDATEIYTIADGIQIFFITPEGYVSAPSYPSGLHVYKFLNVSELEQNNARPPAFLKVGPWMYPLIPGSSPVLETSYGAYMFPDMAAEPGSAVGIIFPPTVTQQQKEGFKQLMDSLTTLQTQSTEITMETEESDTTATNKCDIKDTETASDEHISATIAKGLVTGAEKLSQQLMKGAEYSKEFVRKGSAKLKENLTPKQQEFMCHPKYKEGVQYARKASHTAVQVSSWLVTKLGETTLAIGRQLAPRIKSTCAPYIPKSIIAKDEVDGRSKLDNVAEVAIGGVKGFGIVFNGLEQAAKALCRSLADETVHVVQHKYGSDAGHLTEHTLYSVGNVAMTGYNVKHLGIKAVAKRAAKDTGVAIVEEAAKHDKPNGTDKNGSCKNNTTEEMKKIPKYED